MSSRAARIAALPPGLPPRGLSREEAAAYVGIAPTTFDEMVDDGRMPRPKAIGARRIWDRWRLDKAFSALPDTEGATDQGDTWSRVAL